MIFLRESPILVPESLLLDIRNKANIIILEDLSNYCRNSNVCFILLNIKYKYVEVNILDNN
jgi:hypothetical protein